MSICLYMSWLTCGVPRGQKMLSDPLGLEYRGLWATHVVAGNRIGSSGRAAGAFNHWVILAAPFFFLGCMDVVGGGHSSLKAVGIFNDNSQEHRRSPPCFGVPSTAGFSLLESRVMMLPSFKVAIRETLDFSVPWRGVHVNSRTSSRKWCPKSLSVFFY